MSDNITVRGFVASEIRTSTTPGGVATASFRLGSTDRRYDRVAGAWVDGNTNWFTVQGYRQLAGNIGCSIRKGQRVIIVGRLKMRSWEKDGRIYHVAEIDAESVGHDLMWGSANFTRMAAGGGQPSAAQSVTAAPEGGPGDNGESVFGPEGPRRDDDGEAEDQDDAGLFIEDENGEVMQVDEETGELTNAT